MDYLIVLAVIVGILVGIVWLAEWATRHGRAAQIGAFVLACFIPLGWLVFLLAFVSIRSRRRQSPAATVRS